MTKSTQCHNRLFHTSKVRNFEIHTSHAISSKGNNSV